MTQTRTTRTERDTMGEMEVPLEAYYGASTQRAVLNFPISELRYPTDFIHVLGRIKRAAARANEGLGLLEPQVAVAIIQAAEEAVEGKLDGHFPVDLFQTGSGTSTNTNANEVIGRRATELLQEPGRRGAPERSREHGPIVQRRDSDGDAPDSCQGNSGGVGTGAGAGGGDSTGEGEGAVGGYQDGPHALAGRYAHPHGTGVPGIRGPAATGQREAGSADGGAGRGGTGRHRSGDGGERARRVCRAGVRSAGRGVGACR